MPGARGLYLVDIVSVFMLGHREDGLIWGTFAPQWGRLVQHEAGTDDAPKMRAGYPQATGREEGECVKRISHPQAHLFIIKRIKRFCYRLSYSVTHCHRARVDSSANSAHLYIY